MLIKIKVLQQAGLYIYYKLARVLRINHNYMSNL